MTDFEAGEWKPENYGKVDPSRPRRRVTRRDLLVGGGAFVAGAAVTAGVGYAFSGDLVRWALEGDSQYTQLDWDRIPVEKSDQPQWQKFKGDPEVTSNNPADFKKVGLVAVDAESFDKYRRDNNAQQATAWAAGGHLIDVGTMSTGQSFYSSPIDDGSKYVFGQRIGGSDLAWTPGLWVPSRDEFVVPPDANVQSLGTVAIADLQEQHPGVIYV
jgi:hypothetical protein